MRIISYPVLGSTNDEARRLAEAGEVGPLWVLAHKQESGRGRQGRVWQGSTGNLFCTGLYTATRPLDQIARQSFVAALALYDAMRGWLGSDFPVTIKWPNDILLAGRKAAGILLESGGAPGGDTWLAVGIGVNLKEHPPDPHMHAAHVGEFLLPGMTVPSPEQALNAIIERFTHWQAREKAEGFAPIRTAWLAAAHGLGQPIKTSAGQSGIFEDLSQNGALVLRQPDGRVIEVTAGEVFFS